MIKVNRREFLKMGGAIMFSLALPHLAVRAATDDYDNFTPPPASLGRIATWWSQAVRAGPAPSAKVTLWKSQNEIIPLFAAVEGEAPWSSNPTWYQTEGGFIHSGYVYPSENRPNSEVVINIPEPGMWGQVCIPIAEARLSPDSSTILRKLYYGTVYRIITSIQDANGLWWYRLQEGLTDWAPGPYVQATSIRCITKDELAPISPGFADKWVQIDRNAQALTCYEGNQAVFSTRISTGLAGTPTPRGEFRVLYKRHTRRMTGGEGVDYYDLPGVAFPTYFTTSGVAIHGTYWHNDYGRPHSHGCVNVSHQAAQWIFRWVDPIAPYEVYTQDSNIDELGTRIVVV